MVGLLGLVGVVGLAGDEGFDGFSGTVGFVGFEGSVGLFGLLGFVGVVGLLISTVASSQESGVFAFGFATPGASTQAVFLILPSWAIGIFAVMVKLIDWPDFNSAIVCVHLLSFIVPALAFTKVTPFGALSVAVIFFKSVSPVLVTLIW